jgi:hypothetical protein
MNTNLRVVLSAVSLASVVAAPAVAKSHTQRYATHTRHAALALAHSNYTVYQYQGNPVLTHSNYMVFQHQGHPALAHSNYTVYQHQGNKVLGADPDPQVRLEMQRDGNSSWESMGGGGGDGGFGAGGGGGMGGR